MSYIVKDQTISRFKQQAGYAYEFPAHFAEFRRAWRAKAKNSKRKTLRTHRTGK